jgi:hypothetical protein
MGTRNLQPFISTDPATWPWVQTDESSLRATTVFDTGLNILALSFKYTIFQVFYFIFYLFIYLDFTNIMHAHFSPFLCAH